MATVCQPFGSRNPHPPALFKSRDRHAGRGRRRRVVMATGQELPSGGGRSTKRDGGRWSLQGKTALVTGGTRGIGHAVVEELTSLGASAYTCSRNESELARCLERWEGMGLRVAGSVCDVSAREEREKLMGKVASAFDSKLSILINNVGMNIRKPTIEYTREEFSVIMGTNLEPAFHLCQLAYPYLRASGTGSIVFISSVAGLIALSSGSIASATKGALNQLTRNLACEWAKDNIRVNSVAPWYTRTSLVEQRSLPQVLEDEEFTEKIISRIPLR